MLVQHTHQPAGIIANAGMGDKRFCTGQELRGGNAVAGQGAVQGGIPAAETPSAQAIKPDSVGVDHKPQQGHSLRAAVHLTPVPGLELAFGESLEQGVLHRRNVPRGLPDHQVIHIAEEPGTEAGREQLGVDPIEVKVGEILAGEGPNRKPAAGGHVVRVEDLVEQPQDRTFAKPPPKAVAQQRLIDAVEVPLDINLDVPVGAAGPGAGLGEGAVLATPLATCVAVRHGPQFEHRAQDIDQGVVEDAVAEPRGVDLTPLGIADFKHGVRAEGEVTGGQGVLQFRDQWLQPGE
jgi:hypothetical protein